MIAKTENNVNESSEGSSNHMSRNSIRIAMIVAKAVLVAVTKNSIDVNDNLDNACRAVWVGASSVSQTFPGSYPSTYAELFSFCARCFESHMMMAKKTIVL